MWRVSLAIADVKGLKRKSSAETKTKREKLMKQRLLKWVSARLVAAVALVLPLAAMAATPYAVWDGASPEFDFSVLTRRGYTLGNLGGSYMNTVAADGSYLQIGNNNAKEGITFKKADGTALPASTIIVKCENITATDNYNRALIAYLSSTAYQGSHAFIGIARSKNGTLTINDETVDTVGAGCFIYQGKVWDNTTYVDGAFAPPETGGKVIALSYGNSAGTAYYVDGVKIDSNSNLKSSGFSPMGIVLGGVDTTGNGMFYPMVGMKITAIAFFGEKLSDSDVAAYKFPSENVLTMTALNALTAAGEEGTVDKSFTSLVTMSETDEAPTAATKAFLNDSSWNGIVKIGNVTLGEGSLADFGNANSTIIVVGNGVTFDQLAADTTFAGTLTGDGDITITAVIDPQKTVRFTGDCSTFAGGITIPQSGKARVAFGTGTTGNNNCLIVSEGCTVTVASGKTWTAPNGFVINGNITVAGNLAGGEKIYGTGVVTVANASARTGMIFAGSWTGIAKIAYNPGNARFVFNEFGNASSVVEIIGADNAFSALPSTAWAGGTAPSINPAVVLSANWTVSDGWDNATTSFSKLSGAGNLTVNGSSSGVTPVPYDIVSLNGYTGTLGGARGQFAIEKIYLDATPTPGDKLVNLNASKEFKDIDLTEVYVNGVLDSTIDLEVKADGIYVASPIYVAYTITKEWNYDDPQNPYPVDVTNQFVSLDAALATNPGKIYLIDSELEAPSGWVKSLEGEMYVLTPIPPVAYVDGMLAVNAYTNFSEALAAALASGTHSLYIVSSQTIETLTVPDGCTLTLSAPSAIGGALNVSNIVVGSGASLQMATAVASEYSVYGGLTLSSGDFAESSVDLAAVDATCTVRDGVTAPTVTTSLDDYEVMNNNGTYGVRIDKGWIYEDKDFPNYTGSWTTQVEYGADNKITLDSDNTYTANKPSDGRFVTLNITASFDDVNDDNSEIAGAKAAVRLAAASGGIEGYVFQLYTTTNNVNGCWVDVLPNGDIEAKTNTNYTFTLVLDMTNRTYTAMVDNLVLGLQGYDSVTNFVFATAAATDVVQTLDFRGSGTVTSITGSYENPEAPAQEFTENQEIGSVTLTARQATWLNGQNNYAELAAKIATMDATAFSNAYLLNLNILSAEYDGTYSFTVTEITFGPYEFEGDPVPDTVEAVTIKVELVRKGALDGGINGRLSLKGDNSLPASGFETISEVLIDDETFKDGNVATIVFEKDDEHAAAFYQPVILPIVE